MRISRLTAVGFDGWGDFSASLAAQTNVIYGDARTGKSTLAQLAAHILYGKTGSAWRRQFAQTTPLVEGSLHVETPRGGFVLRRHRDGSPAGRLTVSATAGAAVDSRTVPNLLGRASPRLLARLYAVDFAEAPRVEELFSPEFASEFNAVVRGGGADASVADDECLSSRDSASPTMHATTIGPTATRSLRLDALVARRDELAEQLEQQLAGRRQQSGDLQRQLAELEAAVSARRAERERLVAERRRLQAELAGATMRLRYFALEASARRTTPGEQDQLQSQLEQLDAEIGRCRQTLAGLQQREAAVRHGLAEAQPDGSASNADCLADQRATLGVMERLLDDLDAETAQLARAVESDGRPTADAHARLSPVADLLRQQLYALCGQVTEQERSVQRGHLQAESRQLTRAQTDLSEQLEQLLAQRQAIVHRLRLQAQPVVLYPSAPADKHCRCEHHGRFVVESDAALLGQGDRVRGGEDARRGVADLQTRIDELSRAVAEEDRRLEADQRQWNQWQRSRAGLIDSDAVARLKAEIDEIESRIERQLACGCQRTSLPAAEGWRASDVLAQLTDGRLVQIRDRQGDEPGYVVDRDGRRRGFDQLAPGECDQAYLAVTLALVASHGAAGTNLPLVLDEPFLRQDPAAAAAMAGVLARFAAEGRQTIIFTEDRDAVRRLETLGVRGQEITEMRAASRPVEPAPAPPVEDLSTTRIVRETVADGSPTLRIADAWPAAETEGEICYLAEDVAMREFPVLGEETTAAFAALDIHVVGDLLQADAAVVAHDLARPEVTAAVVALWQTHMRLMCFVPGVSLSDAQLLAACGIVTPGRLADADLDELAGRIKAFLATPRGARFASSADRYCRAQVRRWRTAASNNRQRWRNSPAGAAWKRTWEAAKTGQRSDRSRSKSKHALRSHGASSRRSRQATESLRFFLETSSPVVDAPSIGEKGAALLADVGIRSVADLLACDPKSTAEELDHRRVTAEVVRAWQQQARLVCRIPELRGYSAKLLVACGLTEPTQIAGADPKKLAATIAAYCETNEGERILRGSKAPDLAKIKQWVRHAALHRSLDAA